MKTPACMLNGALYVWNCMFDYPRITMVNVLYLQWHLSNSRRSKMMVQGLTGRWCHTCRSAVGCSFPAVFAAPWSGPLAGSPQWGDACSPGRCWRDFYIPDCLLQQDNLYEKRRRAVEQKNNNVESHVFFPKTHQSYTKLNPLVLAKLM